VSTEVSLESYLKPAHGGMGNMGHFGGERSDLSDFGYADSYKEGILKKDLCVSLSELTYCQVGRAYQGIS
jgi:hypothetical protein